MWAGIQASGRPMVLTVEGNPTDSLITKGGYGNAKRVGHDISPNWASMTSLVDIGAPLWPYAHNSTDPQYGGWWNDLDMIEVGNSPDFACGQNAAALARCQSHQTQWSIMKAPLILGNNIPAMDAATLSVLANKDMVAVNQDALGVQAQRVQTSTAPPRALRRKSRAIAAARPLAAVVAHCDATRASQAWTLSAADGTLQTTDSLGRKVCLGLGYGINEVGGWAGVPCSFAAAAKVTVVAIKGAAAVALQVKEGGALTWDVSTATGPAPFTRYLVAAPAEGVAAEQEAGRAQWIFDNKRVVAADSTAVPGDNNVGGARQVGGVHCLDLAAGQLEVWAGPLTGGRFAVSLFNRSPASAPITATFSTFNASATATYAVRDIWAGKDLGPATGSFTATVATEAVSYLILTPQ